MEALWETYEKRYYREYKKYITNIHAGMKEQNLQKIILSVRELLTNQYGHLSHVDAEPLHAAFHDFVKRSTFNHPQLLEAACAYANALIRADLKWSLSLSFNNLAERGEPQQIEITSMYGFPQATITSVDDLDTLTIQYQEKEVPIWHFIEIKLPTLT